jgi:hypothetical protein
MKLKAQLHILSREAVNYGLATVVMEEAVNPVLAAVARQLKHLQYYVIQNSQGDWLLTTLAHRQQPQQEKRVIYAFATEKMALSAQNIANSPLSTLLIPVTHLLFQLFAVEKVDSIIFLENAHTAQTGKEISRTQLKANIEKQLQKLGTIPANLA